MTKRRDRNRRHGGQKRPDVVRPEVAAALGIIGEIVSAARTLGWLKRELDVIDRQADPTFRREIGRLIAVGPDESPERNGVTIAMLDEALVKAAQDGRDTLVRLMGRHVAGNDTVGGGE